MLLLALAIFATFLCVCRMLCIMAEGGPINAPDAFLFFSEYATVITTIWVFWSKIPS